MSGAAKLLREQQPLLPKNGPVPNRRILVVDDEPQIAEGIRSVLCPAEAGPPVKAVRSSRSLKAVPETGAAANANEFEVVVVNTPEKAIEAVAHGLRENKPFAMGFFDVVLGADMDGIQLVKQLLSVDPQMFAVFVTAYQDRSVDTIGQFLGEENREKWDYINKPFTEGEILQKARNASSLWDLHRLKEWQEGRLSEAHQLLLQHEKQTAVAAVGRSVAHEFGNLLTHIIGNAELAMEKTDVASLKSALELILKASDTAASILKRFRTLHGSAEAPTAPALVEVWQTLDEALELMEFQFRKRQIFVKKNRPQPVLVLGHKHALIQVFVNLFTNAMYVMPTGGDIKITVAADPDWVQISVHDSGPGIAEDILPRVTEALFTTKGRDGSGLGLAITKEIIEIEHGGELVVQNHPKGGAELLIRLPALKPGSKP
jgi:signal transduction histidine kinase